jgi:CPA2 family monovalent cation:H+ antiporter-2
LEPLQSIQLFEVLVLLCLAAAGLALFERLKLPAIAGFLVLGAIAGPGVLGIVQEPERVRALAEIGVVFLLFEIGLDLPLDRAQRLWRGALIGGGLQVVLTMGVVYAIAVAVGMEKGPALVLGGIIAMSSTALVLRLLADQGQVNTPHGQLATSILLFQDLSIVPLLLLVPLLAQNEGLSIASFGWTVVRLAAALAVVLYIVRFAVPRALDRMARLRSPDLFSILAIIIVLGSAFLAEELGLTLAVGAFLAGVAASSSPYAHQLFSEVVPLRGVVLGIFFTAVGMLFEPMVMFHHAPLVFSIVLAATLVKGTIITGVNALFLRRGVGVGALAGMALAQCGEFSFVLAEVAARSGLLSETLHQAVLAASIVSLIATPFLMRRAPELAEALEAKLSPGRRSNLRPARDAANHDRARDQERVIVVGYGPAGRTLTKLLRSQHRPYLVVDANATTVAEAAKRGEHIVFGDAARPAFLERLGVAKAKFVTVAISDPLATRRIVARVRAAAPKLPILARARFVHEVEPLEAVGATRVVTEEYEGSIEFVRQALAQFDFHAGAIRNFVEAMRADDYGVIRSAPGLELDPWLVDLLRESEHEWISVPHHFVGDQSLAELDVRARTGVSVVAVDRSGSVDAVPSPGFRPRAGDRLLVLGTSDGLTDLEGLLEGESRLSA